MICPPFTGQTSEGSSIIMHYSYEFKVKCVDIYERGEYPAIPNIVSFSSFIRK